MCQRAGAGGNNAGSDKRRQIWRVKKIAIALAGCKGMLYTRLAIDERKRRLPVASRVEVTNLRVAKFRGERLILLCPAKHCRRL